MLTFYSVLSWMFIGDTHTNLENNSINPGNVERRYGIFKSMC